MVIAPKGPRRWVWASMLALSALAVPMANAAALRRANWRLEGYVGQAPAQTKTEARLVLQSDDKEYAFDLTRAAVIAGRASRSQLMRDVSPFQNRLRLRGSAAATEALSKASPGQKLVILGFHRAGSRELRVMKISAVAPEAASTTK